MARLESETGMDRDDSTEDSSKHGKNSVKLSIKHPRLERLYSDWIARLHGRRFPSRADFDPADLVYLWGNLSLLDVLRKPLRFHYRVHATEVARRFDIDLSQKGLDALPYPKLREVLKQRLIQVVAMAVPSVWEGDDIRDDGKLWRVEVLILPLARDGETIDMLMVGIEYF